MAGAKALRDAPTRRQGGDRRLLEAIARKPITNQPPDWLKIARALWTHAAVPQFIEHHSCIRLPARMMALYLVLWGFTSKEPMKEADDPSPAAVKKWLVEDYPVIAA